MQEKDYSLDLLPNQYQVVLEFLHLLEAIGLIDKEREKVSRYDRCMAVMERWMDMNTLACMAIQTINRVGFSIGCFLVRKLLITKIYKRRKEQL